MFNKAPFFKLNCFLGWTPYQKVFNYLSVGLTFISIVIFCVETMKDSWINFGKKNNKTLILLKISNNLEEWKVVDTIANIFFIIEIVLRMWTTNPFRNYFKQFPNLIDIMSGLAGQLRNINN